MGEDGEDRISRFWYVQFVCARAMLEYIVTFSTHYRSEHLFLANPMNLICQMDPFSKYPQSSPAH